MGKGARGFLRAQAGASTAFPSAIKVIERDEVGQAGPVTKPVCDSCLSCSCPVSTPQGICSRTFPSSQLSLTGLDLLDPPETGASQPSRTDEK